MQLFLSSCILNNPQRFFWTLLRVSEISYPIVFIATHHRNCFEENLNRTITWNYWSETTHADEEEKLNFKYVNAFEFASVNKKKKNKNELHLRTKFLVMQTGLLKHETKDKPAVIRSL